MDIAELASDYDPDVFMRIVISDDGDVAIKIYGKGEFKIAGYGGGGHLKGDKKTKIINAFRQVINTLNEEPKYNRKDKGLGIEP